MGRFEEVAAELETLGFTLVMLPGEYGVKRRGAGDAAAFATDDLDNAVAFGRTMAADLLVRRETVTPGAGLQRRRGAIGGGGP